MPPTATETDVITREVQIAASPQTVYALLADPEELGSWMGRNVEADARPGGLLRVDYNGFDIMCGSFVELVPHTRIVWAWGWESLSLEQTQPGQSRVEITLEPANGGTLLRLRHTGLGGHELGAHGAGWDQFVTQLTAIAAGGSIGRPGMDLTPAEEYASQLNTLLIRLVDVIQRCPVDAWHRPVTGDGRTVAVVANHIAGHLGLTHFAVATANGERSPVAELEAEAIDSMNAEDARASANITKPEVVATIREAGPAAVAALRAVPAPGLALTQPMRFAGGAHLSAEALLQGPLLSDIREHLAGIEAAVRG